MSLRMNYRAKAASAACLATLVLFLTACGGGHKDTPDAMFVAAKEAVVNDKPVAMWNAMPTEYRNDINGLIHQFGAQIDAKGYDALMGLVRDIASLLKEKKTFVLNSPMVKSQLAGPDMPPMTYVEENYDLVVTMLESISESDLGSASGLQKVDLGSIISKYGGTMMKLAKSLMEMAPPNSSAEASQAKMMIDMMKNATFTVTDKTATQATVTVNEKGSDGKPVGEGQKFTVVKVGDGWVPQEMASQFSTMMSQAKAQMGPEIQQMNQELAAMPMIVGMAQGFLKPLKDAKTQEEFDKAIAGVMGMMGGGGPGGSGGAQPGPAGP